MLLIPKFTYNNAKNASMSYNLFKLNYGFHVRIWYKEDVKPFSKLKAAIKLANQMQKFMSVWRENLQHAQKLTKCHHDKHTKPKSYALDEKVEFNNKYIETNVITWPML